jgi:hypothetical protein
VIYQMALSATGNDNGFVTMFFRLGPGLTAHLSLSLLPWLPQLKFSVTPIFFIGLGIVAVPIFLFSWQAGAPYRMATTCTEPSQKEKVRFKPSSPEDNECSRFR